MPEVNRDGVTIRYIDEGSGPPVVLVHGFAASYHYNWRVPGVIDALTGAGHRVVALDCRGHGTSDKPHDPAAYNGTAMADDVLAVMDASGLDRADLVGYSMGGFIASSLLVSHPERFRRVILSGVGDALLAGDLPRERSSAIAAAMEGRQTEDETARNFRRFAEATGNDLEALAAMQHAERRRSDPALLRKVALPVMVLIGEGDTLVGSGAALAAAIPGAKHVVVPGDHLSAVGKPAFRQAIVDFLAD